MLSEMLLSASVLIGALTVKNWGAQWLSGRALDSRPRGRGFEPHRRHCVVSLSKNINPSLVLVQPRKTRHFITERLWMGRKESNQTKTVKNFIFKTSLNLGIREGSGSVVECLTRDRRAAGLSLTGVTALLSLSKTHLSYL